MCLVVTLGWVLGMVAGWLLCHFWGPLPQGLDATGLDGTRLPIMQGLGLAAGYAVGVARCVRLYGLRTAAMIVGLATVSLGSAVVLAVWMSAGAMLESLNFLLSILTLCTFVSAWTFDRRPAEGPTEV